MNTRITASELAELLSRARTAHEAVSGEPGRALASALDAGDALTAAKELLGRGQWGKALADIGIPASTARLYMQLAAHRAEIEAAGCTSIRQARSLLAGKATKAEADGQGREGRRGGRRSSYDDGYKAGYARGKQDGYRNGKADAQAGGAPPRPDPNDVNGGPPSKADMRWAMKQLHPDVHQDAKDKERAHRVMTWINQLNETRSDNT